MSRLDRAADYIVRNGRLLERRLFAFHFEGGSAEAVAAAIGAYQNADGGFGWCLEPDKRDPGSQPQDLEFALEVLDQVGVVKGPMIDRACAWLNETSTAQGGVVYALPTLNAFPHAPWWHVAQADPPANINPTAAIAGLLLKAGVTHPWLERASLFCFESFEASDANGFHDLMPMITFLEQAHDRPRAERGLAEVARRVSTPGVVALDTAAGGYVQKPLNWAPSPTSFCRKLFSESLLASHLDALAARQEDDGSWAPNWDPISPGVGLEWRGVITLKTLRTLKAYGRL